MKREFSQKTLNKRALNVIDSCDVIIQVLDARYPEDTRNKNLEKRVKQKGKTLIQVLNKADLVQKHEIERFLEDSKELTFQVSCEKFRGISTLKIKLFELAKAKGEEIKVGVIGMPNVGKSTLINRLKKRKSAKTSPIAGTTVGKQWVRIHSNVLLMDSPGITEYRQQDVLLLSGGINIESVQDKELAALKIIAYLRDTKPTALMKKYELKELKGSDEDVLEQIALSKNRLRKGGLPDTYTMSVMIVRDWQTGKIK